MSAKLKQFQYLLFVFVLLLALLSGCSQTTGSQSPEPVADIEFSSGTYSVDSSELKMIILPEELSLLDDFKNLKEIDLSGSTCLQEIVDYAAAHPDIVVKYTVPVLNEGDFANDTASLTLPSFLVKDFDAISRAFAFLPKLKTVDLGTGIDVEGAAGTAEIKKLQSAYPNISFDYELSIYGKPVSLLDTEIDINHIAVEDDGKAVMELLSCMPDCTYLDMDFCGVSNEKMEVIRDSFPDVKVVWRIWFGPTYSVRTDVTRILASFSPAGFLKSEDTVALKYCTDLVYLDIGHNEIDDISFVSSMPNLEVVIIGLNDWTDATPLSSCTKIEYLEIFSCPVESLEPLANMTELRHLNICYCLNIDDLTPIYNLTGLERLWIGKDTPIPEEQVEKFRELVPDCVINTVTPGPTDMGWRVHPRYDLLREQFQYNKELYSYYWLDDKYYPHD